MNRIGIKRSSGQILIGAIGFIAVLGVLFASVYNMGRLSNEKIKAVNAADAAAFSAATLTARRLNFLAYTNRAMISNHVAVGHLVSYISFLRYYTNTATHNPDIFGLSYGFMNAFFIGPLLRGEEFPDPLTLSVPGAEGLSLAYAENHAAQVIQKTSELVATYYVSQSDSIDEASSKVQMLMEDVAWSYDDEIRINEQDDLDAVIAKAVELNEFSLVDVLDNAYLDVQLPKIEDFMGLQLASDDRSRAKNMVDTTIANQRGSRSKWFATFASGENRGFSQRSVSRVDTTTGSVVKHQIYKEGRTESVVNGSGVLDWEATDIIYQDGVAVANSDGKASASEFDALTTLPYVGISGYAHLKGDSANEELTMTAFVMMDTADWRLGYPDLIDGYANVALDGRTDLVLGDGDLPVEISAIAQAKVFYRRPGSCLVTCGFTAYSAANGGADVAEYSNLYNPFWDSRLSY